MEDQDKIGIIAAIIVVIGALVYVFVASQPDIELADLVVLSIQAALTIVIPVYIWYHTTSREKRNKAYVRRKVAKACVDSYALAKNSSNNHEIEAVLNQIKKNHVDVIHLMEIHAHSLDAEEIESFRDWWTVIKSEFIMPLKEFDVGFDEFVYVLEDHMESYIRAYKLRGYYEYLC